jgi:ribonuclease D
MVDYEYIDNEPDLGRMQKQLRQANRVSIDLESDSYHHYGEKIALLQLSDGKDIFLLDPLAVDISSIASLMKDRSREKIFHDVDYDGRMILTFLGVRPFPIFDTMIAARILGKEKVGLADLLNEYFGLDLDKGLQKADWSQRPLSPQMLRYAALDVAYLMALRDELAAEIEKRGRTKWAHEEFSRLVDNLEKMPEREVNVLRFKGARELTPRQLAILQKLLEWRERKARSIDVPSFKIIGNERLIRVAQEQPRSRRELENSKILSPRQMARFGNEIMGAVDKGARVPVARLPRFPKQEQQRRDLAAERILRNLKVVRDSKAGELELDPGFLMPNAVLKAIARAKPQNMAQMEKSGLLKEWQMDIMGEPLVEAVRKATHK